MSRRLALPFDLALLTLRLAVRRACTLTSASGATMVRVATGTHDRNGIDLVGASAPGTSQQMIELHLAPAGGYVVRPRSTIPVNR